MPAQPAYTSAEWKAALDQSVFRILTQMNNAGLLEGTQYGTQSNGCNRSAGVNCTSFVPARADLQQIQPDMFAAAQQIAEASAVLLKNDDNVLPLTCADLTTGNGVVLMGPTAISTYTGGGGSAHVARSIRCSPRTMRSSPRPRPSAATMSRSATCPAMTSTARSFRRQC